MVKPLNADHAYWPAAPETPRGNGHFTNLPIEVVHRYWELEFVRVAREREGLRLRKSWRWCLFPDARRSLTWQLDEINGRLTSVELELHASTPATPL